MASKKSQMPKNATKSVEGSICSNTSIGLMTQNKAKAMELFTSQEADGKTPMTKLVNALTQPKTFISLSTLGAGKHTIAEKENSTFPLKDLVTGGKSSYSTLKTKSSTTSCLGFSPGSSQEVTSSIFSGSSSRTIFMSAMMTETTTIDEKIAKMGRAIAKLTKTVEEKDLQIATLMNKLEVQNRGESSNGQSQTQQHMLQGARTSSPKKADNHYGSSTFIASLSVQQLQDMIANTIRAQYGGAPQSSLMYSKPYTKRFDNLRMPAGYQPPKFQQFDGKGNSKQHISHFIKTCNNVGTEGDLLVKQFVRSLQGNAFNWYTDLEPKSIDSWEQMEREFLNRYHSTRRTMSMMELTKLRQWKDEPVVDYINRLHSLSLDCKDRLSEASGVAMCIQGMHWGLLYIL